MTSQLDSPMSPVNLSAGSASPPPNCAICLGSCSNKCFSDSCMHQFCFKCLLEWSKVKAECPLCKKPFTSIIHNVKSNSEYDEHVLPVQMEDAVRTAMNRPSIQFANFIQGSPPAPSRHQFHFRTTFTVDPDGELAIQQMLLSHPLTTNYLLPTANVTRYGTGQRARRRDTSATSYRRNIYGQNLWVRPQADITGRYRNTSPRFYSENPAARQRLVPWLNRELNALLLENTQQVMHLVDIIMEYLLTHHIRSTAFRNMLREHLGPKTEHFVHEFYTFMRSPFDMIGYDRHATYGPRAASPSSIDVLSDYDDDSDVTVVSTNINANAFQRPVFEVIEIDSDSSHDSDVIIQEPDPPDIVDLANTSDDEPPAIACSLPAAAAAVINGENTSASCSTIQEDEKREPLLPLKIRLKHKRQSREKKGRKRHRRSSSSSSSTSSSSSSSSSTSSSSSSSSSSTSSSSEYESSGLEYSRKRHKHKKKTKSKHRSYKDYKSWRKSDPRRRSGSVERTKVKTNDSSDSDDHLPLAKLSKHKKQKRSHKERYKIVPPKLERPAIPEALKREKFDYSGVLIERIRYEPPFEQCEEEGCSYSDHYPECSTPYTRNMADHQVVVREDYTTCAGPSGSQQFKLEPEKEHLSSTESYISD